jgi:hypothetical protein
MRSPNLGAKRCFTIKPYAPYVKLMLLSSEIFRLEEANPFRQENGLCFKVKWDQATIQKPENAKPTKEIFFPYVQQVQKKYVSYVLFIYLYILPLFILNLEFLYAYSTEADCPSLHFP